MDRAKVLESVCEMKYVSDESEPVVRYRFAALLFKVIVTYPGLSSRMGSFPDPA